MEIALRDLPQYLTAGIQLGERYEDSADLVRGWNACAADTWDVYTPLDRPGSPAPHVWLAPKRALFDTFGTGGGCEFCQFIQERKVATDVPAA